MAIADLSIENVGTIDMDFSFSDKLILLTVREYIRITGTTDSKFVREIIDLSQQALDEYKDNIAFMLDNPPDLKLKG